MKIERVNDNQIKCTLTGSDLSARNLSLSELAYGTEKARNLFHELMQRAYQQYGFEAENMPVMVEAVPMSDESLVLIITRVENPEGESRVSYYAGARSAQALPTKNSRRRFFAGITGCLCSVTGIRSKKSCIDRIFHSLRLSSTSFSTAFPRHRTSQCSCRCCSLAGVMYSACPNSEKAEIQLLPAAFLTSCPDSRKR